MTSDGASCVLSPLAKNHPMFGSGARGEIRGWIHDLAEAEIFLSILLGEDQTPDAASDVTLQTTLWLPQYLKKRAASPKNTSDAFQLVRIFLFGEVMKFGARATGVAKEFAKHNLDLVEYLLSRRNELRSTLQKIADVVDTKSVEPSRVHHASSRIMVAKPIGKPDDLLAMVRYRYCSPRNFYTFLSILLGEPPHDAEPSTTLWFPDFLMKEKVHDTLKFCTKLLIRPFVEVLTCGVRATEVAKAFARMDIVDAEKLLADRTELTELQSTLRRFYTIADSKDTQELIDMFITPFEAGPSTVDALPENLLPNIQELDDASIALAVFRYFGMSEGDD